MIFTNENKKNIIINNNEYIEKDDFEKKSINKNNNKKTDNKKSKNSKVKLDAKNITPKSIDSEIFDKKERQNDDEEVFGIKKSEIYNAITEQLNSKRNTNKINVLKLKRLDSGLNLPLFVFMTVIILILITIPLLSFYFNNLSKASLIDNIISDRSILLKTSKKQQEEREQLKEKLLEEIEMLQRNRELIARIVEEEYLLAVAEIESDYKRRIDVLKKAGYPVNEYENRKVFLDQNRKTSIKKSEEDKDKKMTEQMAFFDQKLKTLEERYAEITKMENIPEDKMNILIPTQQISVKDDSPKREKIQNTINNINEKSEKIKNFNNMVNQLIKGAISDFNNNNINSAEKKLDSVINYYNSQAALVNSDPDLKNKMSGDILLIRTIKELIEQQKVSSSNNAEMTKTFTQMKKISDYSKQGEQYFRSNKMKESEEAFNSAISQVKDVENAFDRLKNIEKYNADVKALPLYNSAMKNLRNNKADAAFTEFSQVIRDYPTSSYSFQSLDQINKIVELKSKEETKPIDETKPKAIFSEANTLYNNKKYQESINKYYELIINYPTSTYIKDSTTNIQKINNIIVSEQKIDNMDEVTKEKFKSEYSKFLTAINRNELKDARDYYFNALNLIINPYTNETIPKFYEAEERYIASLLEGKVDKSSVSTKELEDKYRAEIDNLRKKYEDDIAKLSNTNTKDLENRHKLEIDALKKKYEDDIAKLASSNNTKALEDRHKTEIDALKKKYDDDIAKLASSNNTKDLEDKYKAEMDSLRKKYEADIARLTSSSTKELEEKHRLEIDALRKKYEAELDRSLRERMALDTRDIEEKLENKYKKELEFEKTKIIDDYKYQMEALRKEQDVNKVLTPTELISGKGSLYVGRVIERIDKSITFQLLSKDFVNYIGNGDRLTVIRRDKDNIERFVGYVDVLFITDSSLFARGIVTNETKLEIAPNDILIYTKKENK